MRILQVILKNFRNYKEAEFEPEVKTVVYGSNGSGKSNLLEAIYLAATGKSFRAERDDEMIRYGEKFSILNFQFLNNSQIFNFQITLTDGSIGVTRKKFEVNGIPKRMVDFAGRLRAVLFGPQDIELVTGNPSGRRRYLDFVIFQTDREYRRCHLSYEKGLRQRNKLLDFIRDGAAGRNQLFFWDKLLIKNGEYITQKRTEYIEFLNGFKEAGGQRYKVEYDKSLISQVRLEQYAQEEIAAGNTLVGPHRDDFVIKIQNDWKDVSKYGSRGEQRMAVLWLKLGELKFLSEDVQQPVLLLDDIFSELDHKHRREIEIEIESLVEKGGQVIMTTADEHLVPTDGWNIIKLPI
ncbi:MAG: replication and repair protein RecF protein [Candidatus Amesbacteria bacterium GW2011_GWB1_47_19]|nr:MAG: replication and repair protein RecF protein [Candidatus Amesbacteria bacterium GW2011_GWA1_44_24]KKU31883.1 MAG: replication and repair protein recF protein [Candidatus Amesbacteria bacterium GW2011_GWC1_46_24]KKU66819.1 MAG: replication and repair protein RecF protein [Candidatus Amesbacteria bacterium GW2011_GWB1_47_19]OGD05278.1 MAG: hypothetical protein A2379_03705 [Candidatus Amesbacteria bacterium RIFOXYB1_FULL_47_13]HBC73181.1 hypothetical protein [Candidatus Amesbacteria bacteri